MMTGTRMTVTMRRADGTTKVHDVTSMAQATRYTRLDFLAELAKQSGREIIDWAIYDGDTIIESKGLAEQSATAAVAQVKRENALDARLTADTARVYCAMDADAEPADHDDSPAYKQEG